MFLLERTKVLMDSSLEGTERHCAACRKPIPPESIKICGKCRRRPYCSKECQEKDWKPKRNGTQAGKYYLQKYLNLANNFGHDLLILFSEFQGHKSWCGLTYGEEDLDWVITDVAEKGLGIVSRRVIPAGYRIMVEREQRGENLECGVRSCATMLNHNCDPNAYKSIDTTYGVCKEQNGLLDSYFIQRGNVLFSKKGAFKNDDAIFIFFCFFAHKMNSLKEVRLHSFVFVFKETAI